MFDKKSLIVVLIVMIHNITDFRSKHFWTIFKVLLCLC